MRKKSLSGSSRNLNIIFYIVTTHGKRILEPDYPENYPVGGSETAALRMVETLRKLGHNVRIITDDDNDQLNGLSCDVFVSLRMWQVFSAGYYPGKVNYLWCHDDANQKLVDDLHKPEIALPIYNKLNGLFILSHYQQVQWIRNLNVMVEKIIPTTNGIPLEKFNVNVSGLRHRKPWAYYSSTPFRGLKLLLQAWPEIRKSIPEAQLHLFTSMKVYNVADTPEYEQIYQKSIRMAGVKYHGAVGQAELRDTALRCRALAYPCIFPETSCIVAMEAMAAGCAVVSTNAGALIETAWQNPLIAPGGNWLPVWSRALIKILSDDNEYESLAIKNLATAKYYDWTLVAQNWVKKFLEDLN